MFIGVFMVDDEQAMLGGTVDRNIADIIIIVAELLGLGFRRLVQRIELWRIRKSAITPAQKDIGVIAGGDMVLFINTCLDFLESEGGFALGARVIGNHQRHRAYSRGNGGNGERALEKTPARKPRGNEFAHGGIVGRVVARTVIFLELAGAECRRLVVHGAYLWLSGWVLNVS